MSERTGVGKKCEMWVKREPQTQVFVNEKLTMIKRAATVSPNAENPFSPRDTKWNHIAQLYAWEHSRRIFSRKTFINTKFSHLHSLATLTL